MKKLPPLIEATHMLACAEDLGMVPSCVAPVMEQLRILSLEIQAMPKASTRFADVSRYPYRSVCTFSSHDMAPLRQWWDEDPLRTQDYYASVLHHDGEAPHPMPASLGLLPPRPLNHLADMLGEVGVGGELLYGDVHTVTPIVVRVGGDIDALAVKTAKENGLTNGFKEPEYTVLEGNLTDKVRGKFDVVVANIVADVIIMFCKDVASFMKDGAVFITSGIIDTKEQDVVSAFKKYGFKIKARHSYKGWVCFECER